MKSGGALQTLLSVLPLSGNTFGNVVYGTAKLDQTLREGLEHFFIFFFINELAVHFTTPPPIPSSSRSEVPNQRLPLPKISQQCEFWETSRYGHLLASTVGIYLQSRSLFALWTDFCSVEGLGIHKQL